ncbi:hypothetical protein ACFQL0_22665 [Haloplanus litoreus]|uniref:hypothetical protein n=1 Tax=Haloplanus litoreus TaxID=767515 RepID=UPI00361ABA66
MKVDLPRTLADDTSLACGRVGDDGCAHRRSAARRLTRKDAEWPSRPTTTPTGVPATCEFAASPRSASRPDRRSRAHLVESGEFDIELEDDQDVDELREFIERAEAREFGADPGVEATVRIARALLEDADDDSP